MATGVTPSVGQRLIAASIGRGNTAITEDEETETVMANKNVHVVPHGDRWHVLREGAHEPSSAHDDLEDAIAAGTAEAKQDKVELLVHGRDGQIRMRNSYGDDPRGVKG